MYEALKKLLRQISVWIFDKNLISACFQAKFTYSYAPAVSTKKSLMKAIEFAEDGRTFPLPIDKEAKNVRDEKATEECIESLKKLELLNAQELKNAKKNNKTIKYP